MPILKPIPLLLVLLITTSTTLAAPGDTLYVRGNNVNVRAAPSLRAPILQQVHYGRVVIEIKQKGKWVKVSLSRSKVKIGWIYGSLVKQVPRRENISSARYAIVSTREPVSSSVPSAAPGSQAAHPQAAVLSVPSSAAARACCFNLRRARLGKSQRHLLAFTP